MTRAARNRHEEDRLADAVSDETLRHFAGYNMKRAFNAIQADLSRTLEPFGLRMMTFTTLVLVADNPDTNQTRLAKALAVERSNFVTIVDELEKAGLVARHRSPTDRRSHALRATPAGRALAARTTKAVKAHEERLLSSLGENGMAALIATLRRIESGPLGGDT